MSIPCTVKADGKTFYSCEPQTTRAQSSSLFRLLPTAFNCAICSAFKCLGAPCALLETSHRERLAAENSRLGSRQSVCAAAPSSKRGRKKTPLKNKQSEQSTFTCRICTSLQGFIREGKEICFCLFGKADLLMAVKKLGIASFSPGNQYMCCRPSRILV